MATETKVDWKPLAGATKPCPTDCQAPSDVARPFHELCQGTGRIPFFPDSAGVRVACKRCNGTGVADLDYGQASFYIGCTQCGGTQKPKRPHHRDVPQEERGQGWLANGDGWVWWRAAQEAEIEMVLLIDGPLFEASIPDTPNGVGHRNPEAAFVAALEWGVVAEGGSLGEPDDN